MSTTTDSIEIVVPVGEEDSTDDSTADVLITMEPEKIATSALSEKKTTMSGWAIAGIFISFWLCIFAIIAFISSFKKKT